MVVVSASVNLPLHHKVQKFSSGTSSPGWSRKKGRKMVVVLWWLEISAIKRRVRHSQCGDVCVLDPHVWREIASTPWLSVVTGP